jgi:predicted AAA+ superfamily ATPase
MVFMKKKFNITGTCFPHLHFMADISSKLQQTMHMVEEGDYFVINRPRQYGKTTILDSLHKQLLINPEYVPLAEQICY